MYVNRLQCCGVLEIDGLSEYDSVESMRYFASFTEQAPDDLEVNDDLDGAVMSDTENEGDGCSGNYGVVLFSAAGDAKRRAYGETFKRYIEDHQLGVVVATAPTVNRNTMNPIKVYLWSVNHENLIKWGKEHKVWVKEQEESKPVTSSGRMGLTLTSSAQPPR